MMLMPAPPFPPPPHSAPQFSTYACEPSSEKIAPYGRSYVPGTGTTQYTGRMFGWQSTAPGGATVVGVVFSLITRYSVLELRTMARATVSPVFTATLYTLGRLSA